MRFKWKGQTRRRWTIWEGFQDLIDLCESTDGEIVNEQWFLNELETIGELELSAAFVELAKSGKKHTNPNHSSVAFFLGFTDEAPTQAPVGMAMSQGRQSPPDIDIDIEDIYREDVISYTRAKYGVEKTAQIATFGEMGAKKAVRDVCRVLGYPYVLGDEISKAMPPPAFGKFPSLEKCLESPLFREIYDKEPMAKDVIDLARGLEGIWRDQGIHAAAFLIADAPITEYAPVMQKGPGEPVVLQWDMKQAEEVGLLKMDFLGLSNLNIIARCAKNLKETRDIDLGNPYKLLDELDDEAFSLLRKGRNNAIFQMEGGGFRDLMVNLQPTEFEDISAMLALYRPGPMGSGVHNEYVERKHKRRPVSYLHPSLEGILDKTYGLLIYQEQLIEITKQCAGKDTYAADEFRRIVGKKETEKMPAQKASFVQGCMDVAGMDQRTAVKLFDEIAHHADYSFNKSHSVAYGFVAYLTAYLKAKYPLEYMAAALSASTEEVDRRLYLTECNDLGIPVRPPSVNDSERDFAIKDGQIIYGFNGIKGFGESTIEPILSSRREGGYATIYEFMREINPNVLNKKALDHLLYSGCLDDLFAKEAEEIGKLDKVDLLFKEAKEIGIFFDQHPFSELKDLVVGRVTVPIDHITTDTVDSYIKVAGLLTQVDKINTKAGKKMYKMILEDDTGALNVIVFPAVAATIPENQPLKRGDLIVIEGKIRDDSASEDTDEFKPLLVWQTAERINYASWTSERPIYLKPKKQLSLERLGQIRDIIKGSHGSTPVIIESTTATGEKIVLKFNTTTSPKVEDVLHKLAEV